MQNAQFKQLMDLFEALSNFTGNSELSDRIADAKRKHEKAMEIKNAVKEALQGVQEKYPGNFLFGEDKDGNIRIGINIG